MLIAIIAYHALGMLVPTAVQVVANIQVSFIFHENTTQRYSCFVSHRCFVKFSGHRGIAAWCVNIGDDTNGTVDGIPSRQISIRLWSVNISTHSDG